MANAENPLLSLSSEKQKQIVDLVDNGDIADIAEKGGMTRRQVLQVAVALGAGATAGGYSVDQIIGEARAAADTSDSDGNVGLPGDRVDLFAEGADISGTATANQVGTSSDRFTGYLDTADAAELVGSYAGHIRVFGSSGVVDSIDPSGTTTPVQDALDAAPIGGSIELPAGTVTEEATINWATTVSLRTRGHYQTSTIDMSGVTGTSISFDGVGNVHFEPFRLIGPGSTGTLTNALHFNGAKCSKIHFEGVATRSYYGRAILVDDSGHFQIRFDNLFITDMDSGLDSGTQDPVVRGAIHFNTGGGPDWYWGNIWAYPTDATTGVDSKIIDTRASAGGHVGSMNIGGTAGSALQLNLGSLPWNIGKINYEPGGSNSPTPGIISLATGTPVTVGAVAGNGAGTFDVDEAYRLRGGGPSFLGPVLEINGASFNTNKVDVEIDVSETNIFAGLSSEVTNSTGSTLSQPVSCIGDLTQVT